MTAVARNAESSSGHCKEDIVRTILSRINGIFSMVCGWLMFVLMILLVMDFAGRGVPSTLRLLGEFIGSDALVQLAGAGWLQPISWLGDLSVFIMIIGVYLGLALCEQREQHVRIEILDSLLCGRSKAVCAFLVNLLQVVTVLIMIWAMYRNTLRSIRTDEAVPGLVQLSVWPVKIIVCAGIVLYLAQAIVSLYDKGRLLCTVQNAELPEE